MPTRNQLIEEMREYLKNGLFKNDDVSWCVEDPMFVSAVLILYDVFHDILKATKQFICGSRLSAGKMLDTIADRVTAIRIKRYRPDVVKALKKERNKEVMLNARG